MAVDGPGRLPWHTASLISIQLTGQVLGGLLNGGLVALALWLTAQTRHDERRLYRDMMGTQRPGQEDGGRKGGGV